jgi:DnaK suppressor protein
MARADAMTALKKKLVARRDEMLRLVQGTHADMTAYSDTGDDADAAVVSIKNEMLAKLAEMEERELLQINHALLRMKSGEYGVCEGCAAKIPVARLEALPYATLCVNCQREFERNPERREELEARWRRSLEHAGNGVAQR